MIRKEAWSFYRTISGVLLCWELEEPKGLKAQGEHKQFLGSIREWTLTSNFRRFGGTNGRGLERETLAATYPSFLLTERIS